MMGSLDDNHPQLKRILIPECWITWPLCKDYIAQLSWPAASPAGLLKEKS